MQYVIHSYPSVLPLSQKCKLNIFLKITTCVLKTSFLRHNFPSQVSDGLRASKVWNQPSGFLKLRNWLDQYHSLQICFECRQFCHPAHFKILKKPGKLWFATLTSVTEHKAYRYEFYVLLYTLTNMKTCGKVANTKSWIVMFSKRTPVYSGHWTIGMLQNSQNAKIILQNSAGILQNGVGI